jgi:hypothetical protein
LSPCCPLNVPVLGIGWGRRRAVIDGIIRRGVSGRWCGLGVVIRARCRAVAWGVVGLDVAGRRGRRTTFGITTIGCERLAAAGLGVVLVSVVSGGTG